MENEEKNIPDDTTESIDEISQSEEGVEEDREVIEKIAKNNAPYTL